MKCNQEGNKKHDQQGSLEKDRQSKDTGEQEIDWEQVGVQNQKDGTYRARLVALGYSQIPGIDHTDNFAPVAHDVSFRIAFARMMVGKLDSLVMDVETAFLYGDIEEEIFMKSPVEWRKLIQDHHQRTVTNLKRAYMDCVKQQDNFGRNLLTQ